MKNTPGTDDSSLPYDPPNDFVLGEWAGRRMRLVQRLDIQIDDTHYRASLRMAVLLCYHLAHGSSQAKALD